MFNLWKRVQAFINPSRTCDECPHGARGPIRFDARGPYRAAWDPEWLRRCSKCGKPLSINDWCPWCHRFEGEADPVGEHTPNVEDADGGRGTRDQAGCPASGAGDS